MKKQIKRALTVMTAIILASLAIGFTGCQPSNKYKTKTNSKIGKVIYTKDTASDNATYYVIVADTSRDYNFLHTKMFSLNKELNIPIDTMGRYFNKDKKSIVLPDNDKDEMYAGEYYPRRYPSKNLSLEYLSYYDKKAGENTFALVAGIYETQKSADSAITVLSTVAKKTFKIKATIFIGCMH